MTRLLLDHYLLFTISTIGSPQHRVYCSQLPYTRPTNRRRMMSADAACCARAPNLRTLDHRRLVSTATDSLTTMTTATTTTTSDHKLATLVGRRRLGERRRCFMKSSGRPPQNSIRHPTRRLCRARACHSPPQSPPPLVAAAARRHESRAVDRRHRRRHRRTRAFSALSSSAVSSSATVVAVVIVVVFLWLVDASHHARRLYVVWSTLLNAGCMIKAQTNIHRDHHNWRFYNRHI